MRDDLNEIGWLIEDSPLLPDLSLFVSLSLSLSLSLSDINDDSDENIHGIARSIAKLPSGKIDIVSLSPHRPLTDARSNRYLRCSICLQPHQTMMPTSLS
jgi:hypothetical protein